MRPPILSPGPGRGTAAALFLLAAFSVRGQSPDLPWPAFRGPHADGVGRVDALPLSWSRDENVDWVVEIPGRGWSSPIVANGRVFLTTAVNARDFKRASTGLFGNDDIRRLIEEEGKSPQEAFAIINERDTERPEESGEVARWLLCLDAESGETLWRRELHRGPPPEGRHRKNTWASETPVTDGERVYAYFGNLGVWAFTLDGQEVWSRRLDHQPIYLEFGTASSPALDERHLYLVHDNEQESWIAALDKRTGEERWRIERSEGEHHSAWSTPFVWRYEHEGRSHVEVVAPGAYRVTSYSPSAGEELWRFEGYSRVPAPTPFAHDGLLLLSAGSPSENVRPLLAVRPGARGELSADESSPTIAWYHPREGTYIPSPVAWKSRLYVLSDKGFLAAFDLTTGERLFKARVEGGGHAFSSSPWAWQGRIFALSEDGDTFVFQAADEYRLLGVNALDELTLATPAIAYDSLFLRTETRLYRLRDLAVRSDGD